MKRNITRILLLVCVLAGLLTACITREKAMQQKVYQNAQSGEACVVSYYVDGRMTNQETLAPGGMPRNVPANRIWVDEDGDFVAPETIPVKENVAYYAWEAPAFREKHIRFITAVGNQFLPENPVTRGEMAQMLCALLDMDSVSSVPVEKKFSDVGSGNVSNSIRKVVALSVMSGYPDGTFRPDAAVTRAEFAAILCRLGGVVPGADGEYWAQKAMETAREMGWMTGYDDGDAYPETPVTRAEAVVMFNRIRERTPNRAAIDLACEILPYVDVTPAHWAFYDIIDASYSSDLIAYISGDANAKPGFILIDDQLCHVNGETLRLDYYTAGFHTIEDGLYYVAQDGYFIERFEKGLLELDGSMFCVTEDDGPFLTDGDFGYLHFREDGRYTSGSDVVDEHVDRILKNILPNDSLSQEEKLHKAYLAIRDGGYSYMARPTGWQRGSDYWTLSCARVMYESKRGVCYYWASAFLYLARRLGYEEAYAVCGGVGTQNQLHAWVVIPFDGEDYIFDVELEWAYMWDFYQRGYTYMNMFKQPRSSPNAIYIFPGENAWYYGAGEENNEDDVIDVPEDAFPEEDESGGASGEGGETDDPEATPPVDDPDATPPADNPDGTTPPDNTEQPDATVPPDDTTPTEPPPATDAPPVATEPPPATDAPPEVPDTPVEPEPVVPETPVEPAPVDPAPVDPAPETGGEEAAA